jgi:hypothetical protein
MTTFSRSRPLNDVKPTARENEDRNTPHKAHEGRTATSAPLGATGTASLLPSKIKSQTTIKNLRDKTTTTIQAEDTNAPHPASSQETCDSKTIAAMKTGN